MSTGTTNTWDVDDDTDDTEQQDTAPKSKGSGLRAFAEQTRKENEELKAQLAKLQEQDRTRNVAEALKAKGLSAELAELVPAKIAGDPTELDKWLTEKSKLFRKTKQDTDHQPTSEPPDVDEDDLYDEDDDNMSDDVDALGRMSRVSANALSPSRQQDTMFAIRNAKDRKEIGALLRKFGNQNF